jgi:SlyX protein
MESRIIELEIKISYTEDMVDELNRSIFRQQQQIDFLARELNTLRQQVQSAAAPPAASLLDELPPHY